VAAAVEAALDLVNLKEFMHRATHTLSGGQRQRVAIAGACTCWGLKQQQRKRLGALCSPSNRTHTRLASPRCLTCNR
jgi:ABC-type hemin transport system ATPase subunit